MFDVAFEALADAFPLVRHNAARALGKLLMKGMLTGDQEGKLGEKFGGITGQNGANNWDNAFIVRHEAEKYASYFRDSGSTKNKYYQSFRILEKRELCPDTFHYSIQAPLIAKKLKAGQFVIVRPTEYSERIPLSICGWDGEKGVINLIVMAAGRTSREITQMSVGNCLADIVGPLGERSHVKKHEGTCVVIGGGYGTGAVIPTARDLKALGNRVIGIVGARNEKLLIMVDELKTACDEVMLTTNDGTAGIQGFVTHALEAILKRGEKISHVLAVGPVPMMIAVSNMTKPLGIETYVSLNAIMVDGTGMCGACRVSVGGETKFACFHGPDFDGHKVDFDQLMKRQKMFVAKEKEALAAVEN
jgi:ferredoxin--NADP+ reductase